MCKTNDNAREINAAARNTLSRMIADQLKMIDILQSQGKNPAEWIQSSTSNFMSYLCAFMAVGIIDTDELTMWSQELRHARQSGTVETMTCDDCGATVPHDLVTVLGDNDLCLCPHCRKATCGPAPTNEQVERGSDGCGDFEDAPRFQRGTPVELD